MKVTYNYEPLNIFDFKSWYDDIMIDARIHCMLYGVSAETNLKFVKLVALHLMINSIAYFCKKNSDQIVIFAEASTDHIYNEVLKSVKSLLHIPQIIGEYNCDQFCKRIENRDTFTCASLDVAFSRALAKKFKPSDLRARVNRMRNMGLKEFAESCGEDIELKFAMQY